MTLLSFVLHDNKDILKQEEPAGSMPVILKPHEGYNPEPVPSTAHPHSLHARSTSF
jgi:hypothetical protein